MLAVIAVTALLCLVVGAGCGFVVAKKAATWCQECGGPTQHVPAPAALARVASRH